MGHKGYGLSVIVDLIGALLGGAGAGTMGSSFSNNFAIWAVDPEALAGRDEMQRLQQDYFAKLKSSARKPGVDEILLPGEPERNTAAIRRRDGLPLDGGTVAQLDELATRLNLQSLSARAAT